MPHSLYYYLAWICLIHLALFSGILFLKKDNRKANRTLGFFMLILASIHLSHVLILSGKVYQWHWLNELCFLLLYLEGPLYLQYTADMTGTQINWKRRLWIHLLPFVPPALFFVSFAFKDPDFIRSYYDAARIQQPVEAMVLLSIVTLQMTVYMIWSLQVLRKYNDRIHNQSYHQVMSLQWLYRLTLTLLFFSLFGVPLLLLFVHSDLSVLYLFMPVITMAIYLVLFYKSINFPGTEYEKKLIREQEREKISRDMHDELGAGITRIALLSEIAKREPAADAQQLDEISGSARQLAHNLREIVWGLNPQNDTFDNLMAYIREYSADYFDNAGIHNRIHFPKDIPGHTVSHELRRNVCLIIKEAIHNIAKHAQASYAEITLQITGQHFSLYITDNGVGVNQGNQPPGNGLKNMRIRTEFLNGRFSVLPDNEGGTIISLEQIPYT